MAKKQFYISICVDNLAQFFAFGFITPANLFPFRYYLPDELSLYPNVIPMHNKPNAKSKISRQGLNRSKQEDKNLKSAVIVISIDESRLVRSEISPYYQLNDILPTYQITQIIFEDKAAREHFDYLVRIAGRVSNDLLEGIDFKDKGFNNLFQPDSSDCLTDSYDESKLIIHDQAENTDKDVIRKMSAYGAGLSLAYVMAKNSSKVNVAFKELTTLGIPNRECQLPIVRWVEQYFTNNLDSNELEQIILRDFFDILICCDHQDKVLDKLIPFFNSNIEDENVKNYLNLLKEYALDILKGKSSSTKSQLMAEFSDVKRGSQFIRQVVTMFALLDDTEKLFTQPITTITGEGYLNIVMAYGIRDKFYNLPKDVRQIKGLECYVIERMYEYYQEVTGNCKESFKPQYRTMPTLLDVLSDLNTPKIKNALSHKFDLVSENIQQKVSINGYSYVPEYPEKMITILHPESEQFATKMIEKKPFEDIDFNFILELYEQERLQVKAEKKFVNSLNKL